MATATDTRSEMLLHESQPAQPSPAPLRLPKALLQHLAKPFESLEDVDRLIAHIRICEWRGLL